MRIKRFLSGQSDFLMNTLREKSYCVIIAVIITVLGIITGILNHSVIAEYGWMGCGRIFTYKTFINNSFFSFFGLLVSSVLVTVILSCLCGVNKWAAIAQYVFLFIFTAGFTAGICVLVKTLVLLGILLVLTIFLIYGIFVIVLLTFVIVYTRGDDFSRRDFTTKKTIILTCLSVLGLIVFCFVLSVLYVLLFRPILCFIFV